MKDLDKIYQFTYELNTAKLFRTEAIVKKDYESSLSKDYIAYFTDKTEDEYDIVAKEKFDNIDCITTFRKDNNEPTLLLMSLSDDPVHACNIFKEFIERDYKKALAMMEYSSRCLNIVSDKQMELEEKFGSSKTDDLGR